MFWRRPDYTALLFLLFAAMMIVLLIMQKIHIRW